MHIEILYYGRKITILKLLQWLCLIYHTLYVYIFAMWILQILSNFRITYSTFISNVPFVIESNIFFYLAQIVAWLAKWLTTARIVVFRDRELKLRSGWKYCSNIVYIQGHVQICRLVHCKYQTEIFFYKFRKRMLYSLQHKTLVDLGRGCFFFNSI